MAAMVRIDDLVFDYGRDDFRLRVPDLEVERGQKMAVIGPSGSGKTSLLHLIAGIETPSAGRIRVGDTVVTDLSDAGRRAFRISKVGFVFQDFELVDYLPVLDNILHPYRLHRALRLDDEVRSRACELAREVGVDDKLGRYVDQLSQGERQRVAICRALVTRPDLVLADEATGNLDPATRDRVLELLFGYIESNSDAILMAVTHDHQRLSRYDRVLDLRDLESPALHEANDG